MTPTSGSLSSTYWRNMCPLWDVLSRPRTVGILAILVLFFVVLVFPSGRPGVRRGVTPELQAPPTEGPHTLARDRTATGRVAVGAPEVVTLRERFDFGPLLRLQRADDASSYIEALTDWTDQVRRAYPEATTRDAVIAPLRSELLGADAWFAPIFGLFVASVAAWLTRPLRTSGRPKPLPALASLLILAPMVAVAADWLENALNIVILARIAEAFTENRPWLALEASPEFSNLVLLAHRMSTGKFAVYAIVIGSAAVIAVADAVAPRRTDAWSNTSSAHPPPDEVAPTRSHFVPTFAPVLGEEKRYLVLRRRAVRRLTKRARIERVGRHTVPGRDRPARYAVGLAGRHRVGLAFSGGGIRSAAFNLGVVQGLSRLGILPAIDYLSSVSGGGFPAGCMASLLAGRRPRSGPRGPVAGYEFSLRWSRFPFNPEFPAFDLAMPVSPTRPARALPGAVAVQPRNRQLDYLRDMGNYLIPRRGALGRDMLRGVGALGVGTAYTLSLFSLLLSTIAAAVFLAAAALSPPIAWPIVRPTAAAALVHSVVGVGPDQTWPPYAIAAGSGFGFALVASVAIWWLYRQRARAGRIDADATPRGRHRQPPAAGRTAIELEDTRTLQLLAGGFAVALIAVVGCVATVWVVGTKPPLPVGLWLPLAFTLGQLAGFVAFRLLPLSEPSPMPRDAPANPDRPEREHRFSMWGDLRFRSVFWAAQGLALYAAIAAAAFALVSVTLPYDVAAEEHGAPTQELEPSGPGAGTPVATATTPATADGSPGVPDGSEEPGRDPGLERVAPPTAGKPLALTVVSFLAAWALAFVESRRNRFGPYLRKALDMSGGFRNAALTLALGIALVGALLLALTAFELLTRSFRPGAVDLNILVWIACAGLFAFAALGRFVNLNYVAPHYFTRDRIADAFLRTQVDMGSEGPAVVARDDREMLFRDANPDFCPAPYHLVLGSVNLSSSWHLRNKDRRAEPFLFSARYCGSRSTGFVPTATYGGGLTKLARALAISGAAVSPGTGHLTNTAQSFLLSLLNLRLGLWVTNPRSYDPDSALTTLCAETGESLAARADEAENHAFWPAYLLDEMTGSFSDGRMLVNVTDGAHWGDNLGLYELLARRCSVIVVGDASADDAYAFTDLFRVIHLVEVDFGIRVEIDVSRLKPTGAEHGPHARKLSLQRCAVGRIFYPPTGDASEPREGWLICLKPTLIAGDPSALLEYWSAQESFPLPSTADQFFDEYQYEAQRALGEHTVLHSFRPLIAYLYRASRTYDLDITPTVLASAVEDRLLRTAVAPTSASAPRTGPDSMQGTPGPRALPIEQHGGVADIARLLDARRSGSADARRALTKWAMAIAEQVIDLTRRRDRWNHEDITVWETASTGPTIRQDQRPAVVGIFREQLELLERARLEERGLDFIDLDADPFDPGLLRRMAATVAMP